MVIESYNLREQPFGVTPDPKYLYMSPTHREALASLEYGISSSRGFLGLVAPPGMGKTTILFHLLQRLNQTARTVFIFQTHTSPRDFLRNLLSDMGMPDSNRDLVTLQAELNKMLLEEAKAGRRVVVVVDEAQNLEDPVLEHLRMLSNFETTSEKLIQIVLAGQTQLADKLASPGLVQLRQRISIMGRLAPFDRDETERYISHRLEVAGYESQLPLFTPAAFRLIAEASGGIPRNINNICFNALALGCANQQRTIPSATIREVCHDLDLDMVQRLAPPVLAVKLRPTAPPQIKTRFGLPSNQALFHWWLRFGPATLILAIAIAGLAVLGRKASISHGAIAPVQHAETNNSAPISATTLDEPAIAQKPNDKVPEAGSTIDLAAQALRSSQSPVATPQPEALLAFKTVRVTQDQTLSSIAIQELGAYTPKNMKAIQELNPWITDLDHIRAGLEIRIPEPNLNKEETMKNTKSSPEAQ